MININSGLYTSFPIVTSIQPNTCVYTPSPTITPSSYATSSWTINTNPRGNLPKYSIFYLPQNKCPKKIYIGGCLVSIGVIGSKAICAFMGNKIIIETEDIRFDNEIVIEYKDYIYYYEIVKNNNDDLIYKLGKILDLQLISKVRND